MLNQLIIVGRLTKDIEFEENKAKLTLACPRPFKNDDGMYDTDFIDCVLWNNLAKTTAEYCKKGDIVGIKGRLSKLPNEETKVIAEKVTFLSSKKGDEDNDKKD